MRPSPGRVTSNNLWSPLSIQGPMARTIPDLALFLDTMASLCPHDPLTFDAPADSFTAAVARLPARPPGPLRIAFTANYGGRAPVDREICAREVRKFEAAGCIVEEAFPKLGPADEVFLVLAAKTPVKPMARVG